MKLNIQEIMEIIPHRQPFLLIDAVEECEPGVSCVARKCVTMNEPFFGGHFPGQPVMPGVLILEALAQTGAVAALSLDAYKGKTAFFGGMDRVKFKRMVVPGDVLRLETKIIKMKGPVGVAEAVAYVGDQVAASAELTVIIK
ncbi:MAG: 3-hydroxyacyl-ACP dehydratase FabZ [Lachnospiraceae bacterium]|nr:3-hydroxyacyl-ACP dehydratase FabZ [Lachnospiraceae bacterium]